MACAYPEPSEPENDVLSILSCDICTDLLKKTILCENGHTICKKCSKKVNVCPFCRGEMTESKNVAIENIVAWFRDKPQKGKLPRRRKSSDVDVEIVNEEMWVEQFKIIHMDGSGFDFLNFYDMYF